jgi:SAM-dependent methyltransferase
MSEKVFYPPQRKGMRGHPTDLVIAWAVEKFGARRLVDMGCGNGRDATQLLGCGLADFIVGVDTSQETSTHLAEIVAGNMVPAGLKDKFFPVVADYQWLADLLDRFADAATDAAVLSAQAGGIDMAYSNNAIEHVPDPGDFIDVSLKVAPVAIHVAPHERHGWFQANLAEFDKHMNAWDLQAYVDLAADHGDVVDYGKLLEPEGCGQHCLTPECEHSSMFVIVRRR